MSVSSKRKFALKGVLVSGLASFALVQATPAMAEQKKPGADETEMAQTLTLQQRKQKKMKKMQAQMAKNMANKMPATQPIYDPAGGDHGRNLKRDDTTECLQWYGGPAGTLVPLAMSPPPVPMEGTHGMVGAGYNDACGRGEAFLSVSSRHKRLFFRGQVYGENVGAYTAPSGAIVDNSSDRLTYGIGAGYLADNGSFLSFDIKQMRRDEIRYAGASADTRQFDLDRYELAGKLVLDRPGLRALTFNANWNEFTRVNDNFSYRTVAAPPTEVRLKRETANARLALEGGGNPFQWTLGLEYALDRRDGTRYQGPALAAQSPNFADAEVSSVSVTGDGVWALAQDRRVKAGLRFDFVEASLGGIDRTGLVTGGGATPTPRQMFMATYGYAGDGSASEVNPSAYLRYEQDMQGPGKGQYFSAMSYKTRTASPFERYFTSFTPPVAPSVFNTWIGNPTLKPEKHLMIELGAGRKVGPWTLAGRVYGDHVGDFILWDRARGQAGVARSDGANIFRNVDAFITGLEASAKYDFNNGFWAGADMWLTHGKNLTDNRPIGQIPAAEAALKLGWSKNKWSLQSKLRLVAKQNRLDSSMATGSGVDGNGSGGYSVLDLEATWNPKPNLAVSFGVDNVLDRDYVPLIERSDISDPSLFNPMAPGRSVWIKATMRF